MSPGPRETLAALASEYWEMALAWNPLMATLVGDRRYDDRMPDVSPEAFEAQRDDLDDLARRASAIAADALGADERVTRLQLIALARDGVDERSTGFETWLLDPLEGPQVSLLSLPAWHTVRTRDEAEAFVGRVEAMGPYLDQFIANLERGHAAGLSSSIDAVRKVEQQLGELLAKPSADWALVAEPVAGLPRSFDDAARRRLRDDLEVSVERAPRPGFERLAAFVKGVARPKARPADRPGLCALPGGLPTYDKTLRIHTSLPFTAQSIHDTGLAEVRRINDETRALGARALGSKDLATIQTRLRNDPALHFRTRGGRRGEGGRGAARAPRRRCRSGSAGCRARRCVVPP